MPASASKNKSLLASLVLSSINAGGRPAWGGLLFMCYIGARDGYSFTGNIPDRLLFHPSGGLDLLVGFVDFSELGFGIFLDLFAHAFHFVGMVFHG